jgi:branched-subunit amino acid ABC-type transport system permease component
VAATAWLVIALAAALAAWATHAVVTSSLYERRQVVAQLLIAWLVPVVGPIVLLLVVRSLTKPQRGRSQSGGGVEVDGIGPQGGHHGGD